MKDQQVDQNLDVLPGSLKRMAVEKDSEKDHMDVCKKPFLINTHLILQVSNLVAIQLSPYKRYVETLWLLTETRPKMTYASFFKDDGRESHHVEARGSLL